MSLSNRYASLPQADRWPPPDDPADEPERLRQLVRRIAIDDHDAFRELYACRSGPVAYQLSRQIWDPYRAAGILAGTFVEVWWLAGGRVDPGTDVVAWIEAIAQRRVVDSRPAALSAAIAAMPRAGSVGAQWARFAQSELGELLGRPAARTPASKDTVDGE